MDFFKYFDDQEIFYLREHLRGLVEDVYQTGSIPDLEFHLQEILSYFDIKIPETDPVLIRKPTVTKIETILNAWKKSTIEYGKALVTK